MVMFIHLFLFWIYYSSPFKISIILYHGSVVRKSGWLPEGGNLMKLFDNLIFLLSCKYFPMQSLYYPGPPTQVHTGTLFTWMMWTQSYWSGLAFYFLWWIACKTFLKRTYSRHIRLTAQRQFHLIYHQFITSNKKYMLETTRRACKG